MSKPYWRLFAFLLIIALVGFVSTAQRAEAKEKAGSGVTAPAKQPPAGALKPIVVRSVRHDTSIPLRDMKPLPIQVGEIEKFEIPNKTMPKALVGATRPSGGPSTTVQGILAPEAMPPTFQNFDAQPNNCNCAPPDPNGDVGPNNYVSSANSQYAVFDKSGNVQFGPININTIWSGFGGDCETQNHGDPIVLYDHLSDRWLISQFSVTILGAPVNSQCIAISQTGDPTGSFHRYQFFIPGNKINDYPKFGVWPDAYYMTVNQFNPGWAGAGAFAFERDQMLLGNAAQMVYFDLFPVNINFGGMLPSDLDGPAPPAGTPNVFAEVDDQIVFGDFDRLSLWDFHVDWVTPASSTFGVAGNPNTILQTAPFDWDMCPGTRDCIPQPGTGTGLDAISDRLMFRLQYRNFGAYATLVGNHTVDADGSDHAGVDWFELRDSGAGWVIHQEGIYAPDSEHRWMGSAAMDSAGNIAVGYSVSSSTVFPSLRYSGRLASDPLGQLSQGEATIHAGSFSQADGANRWGDYSAITVDPSPGIAGGIDCDFWYINEYLTGNGWSDWQTRVGAFSFAPGACGGPSGTLNGTVTDSSTTNPIAGATVLVNPGGFSTTTNGSGQYQFVLAVGTYDVTASAYGYFADTVNGLSVTDGGTTTQNFALDPAPVVTVSGTVTDNGGHGWPLYARIDIAGYPFGSIFTDPFTGDYSVDLVQATPYVFNVQAISPGYIPESRNVTPPGGGSTEDFALDVQPACSAPGYGIAGGLFETFETGSLPVGWTNIDNIGGGLVWEFNDPGGRGNLTGGSGGFAVSDSDHDGCCFDRDTELVSPAADLSGQTGVHLQFDTYFQSLGDIVDADISIDGGTSWTNVWSQTSNLSGHQDIDISGIADNEPSVMVRFHHYNANWAWWWEVDNVNMGNTFCAPVPGGLLIGNTLDLNTGSGMNDVAVTADAIPTETTTSFATPDDPNVDDGFYILFSSQTGTPSITATKTGFGPDTQTPTVIDDTITVQDFHLGAGFLVLTPNPMDVTVDLGDIQTFPLTVDNTGTAPADFELKEGEGLSAFNIHASAPKHDKKALRTAKGKVGNAMSRTGLTRKQIVERKKDAMKRMDSDHKAASAQSNLRTTKDIAVGNAPAYKKYPNAAGDVIQTWDPGLVFSWGIATDPSTENVWVDSPSAGWGGDNNIHEFLQDGTSTGLQWPHSWGPSYGPADTTMNPNTGMLWSMDVGGDDCIHEIDPTAGVTGNTICPGFSISQRGLAYDPETDTYFAGSWNDLMIHHFDSAGNMLDEVSVGLSVSGLAYNPETQHLFVMVNASTNDIYVLDAANGYASLGQFSVSGFGSFSGAGLELGCDGTLWAVNQASNTVYQIDSGETASICAQDVPWLSENPTTGTVPDGGSQNVDVTFDTTGLTQPGDYYAHLKVKENTPYAVPDVQITMHVPLPPGWGWLNGNVDGLGRCDAPGGPLNKATVFVDTAGTDFTLETDATGYYQVAFLATDGPATVTVSYPGYVLQTLAGVVITDGGTTTSDFSLRLDAPCGSKSPTSFDVSVNAGGSTTLPLTLSNAGAGGLDFEVRESAFPLPPLITKPFPARNQTVTPNSVGPASVRALVPHGAAKNAAKAPNSGWFFALPVPGGLVRYAFAQCDVQPNYYYVISGVDGTFSVTANAWRYDATSNTWTALAPIPTGSEGPTAACYQGKLYVMGGGGGNQMFIYDISSDTWTSGASLPRGVATAAAGAWNGLVYLIGGDDDFTPGTGVSNEVDVYDIASDTWIGTGSPMPIGTSAPGFVQAGPDVFVVGGWGDLAPGTNADQTMRYNMDTDTWSTGPVYTSAHADLALAVTDTALYVMGGDGDGGGFFDSTADVERLDLSTWPAGAWADFGDDMPVAQTANNAGFCTEAFHLFGTLSEIYSLGGIDPNFVSSGNNAFHGLMEHCYSIFSDVPWLSESPTAGTVAHDSNGTVDVTFSAGALPAGDYNAVLVVTTNDSGAPQFNIPVTLHVAACMFCDEFADDVLAANWTYTKVWTESGGVLTTTNSGKATAVASPAFGGCQNCSIATQMATSAATKVWIYGWWVDKNNVIEMLFKEFNDKVVVKQRVGGNVVKKQSAPITINAGIPYTITATNNGTTIVINVDGTDVLTFTPIGVVPSGTVGFGAKAGTTSLQYIHVN